jgi:hypothetical protein
LVRAGRRNDILGRMKKERNDGRREKDEDVVFSLYKSLKT